MSIGEKILELRKRNSMTQRELGERLNVSDKVISKWETGKSL
ncbi:MAG: helix-turn-helix transcriptional regulator, partial [Lentisphaeria bacterium]|nr:helix-turn-helix transcriptional regulator [Lentisphaeria bacterium]